jgi:hypothetical protein
MFDAANNRLSYGELLQPDIGYTLDFAVGLTYSLDLEALLGMPISFGLLDEVDPSVMKSPFYLLEAIRKSSDRLAVFCNAGSISLPQHIQSVYSLLENSVFEIKLRNKQNFHPKLWLAKYVDSKGSAYMKLLVLSRNMTFDTSIDLCVEMKGTLAEGSYEKNKPLADLLCFVSKKVSGVKKQRILGLAQEVMRVKAFDLDRRFEDYEFLPMGNEGHREAHKELFERKRDLFAVSPFLSDDVVKGLANCSYKKALVTRKSSITKTVMDSFERVYITKDVLSDNEYGFKQDIHAKLYFTTTKSGNYLYIGSANASHNAFYKNVEFLLKLKYEPGSVGFQRFFTDFIPEENCPYERIESVPEAVEADEKQRAIDKAMKAAVHALKGAEVISNGDTYNVLVKLKKFKSTEHIQLAPLQRKEMRRDVTSDQREIRFDGILLKDLSEFYIITVQDQRVVAKIKTKGMPKDRDNAIYKSIIDSRSKFLSYVSLILADDQAIAMFEQKGYEQFMAGGGSDLNGPTTLSALYEKMLKAVHQHPERLGEIAEVIRRVDQDVISPEFMDMYKQFKRVARRLKR